MRFRLMGNWDSGYFSSASTLEISFVVTPIVLDTLSRSSSVSICRVLFVSSLGWMERSRFLSSGRSVSEYHRRA